MVESRMARYLRRRHRRGGRRSLLCLCLLNLLRGWGSILVIIVVVALFPREIFGAFVLMGRAELEPLASYPSTRYIFL